MSFIYIVFRNISVILHPCIRVLDALMEMIQYIKNVINNIVLESESSDNNYRKISDCMTECQSEFHIFAQNVRKLFSLTMKANVLMATNNFKIILDIKHALLFVTLAYETVLSRFLQIFHIHSYSSDSKEKQLSKIEKLLLNSKVDVAYVSYHQFSDISFRQLSQLLISILGISHEDVLSVSELFHKSDTFLPVETIRYFSHKVFSSLIDIENTEQSETYDSKYKMTAIYCLYLNHL